MQCSHMDTLPRRYQLLACDEQEANMTIPCCNEQEVDEAPFALSESNDNLDAVLQKLLEDFDPNYELFSNSQDLNQSSVNLTSQGHKRRVSFDHAEAPLAKKMSPVSDEEQRRARNELWKQSLKRSMFHKHAPIGNDVADL
ncbi:hypothetical protein MPSEU_001027900 [Mayamaea pseudoterrestris]|nr:hypothetical protein MPSEU_000711700 [Mayamaea pseudoterrestris]GKZ00761.1 hypothetical protein MPSEU_001027900 [Mayamaea pseudoterrestris]